MRWFMSVLVVIAGLGLAAAAGAEQRYTDTAGDSSSAPDLGQLVVSNDPSQVVFQIAAPARLPGKDEAYLLQIDSDGNPASGENGFEVNVFMMALSSDVDVWNGSSWVAAPPAGISVRFEFSSASGLWRVTLPRTLLSNTTALNFWLGSAVFNGDDIVASDRGPDGGTWRYELAFKQCANGRDDDGDGKVDSNDLGCSGTEDDLESDDPYTLAIDPAKVTPASGRAGKPVVVRAGVRQVETNQPIATGTVRCITKVGSKTRRSAGQLASGTATCRLVSPKVAKRTTIRGTMTVTSKSASISAPYSFRAM
jgi:hypothetical protein